MIKRKQFLCQSGKYIMILPYQITCIEKKIPKLIILCVILIPKRKKMFLSINVDRYKEHQKCLLEIRFTGVVV